MDTEVAVDLVAVVRMAKRSIKLEEQLGESDLEIQVTKPELNVDWHHDAFVARCDALALKVQFFPGLVEETKILRAGVAKLEE